MMDAIEVTARFAKDGRVYPQRVTWQGIDYPVESTGRSWQDQEGLHILVMIPNERVLELIFQPEPRLWFLKSLPAGRQLA
jgi:hypothetical protein